MLMSSIGDDTFMSRLAQLQQRVSEAVWRYQLVLQDSVAKEFGTTILRPAGQKNNRDDEGFGRYLGFSQSS